MEDEERVLHSSINKLISSITDSFLVLSVRSSFGHYGLPALRSLSRNGELRPPTPAIRRLRLLDNGQQAGLVRTTNLPHLRPSWPSVRSIGGLLCRRVVCRPPPGPRSRTSTSVHSVPDKRHGAKLPQPSAGSGYARMGGNWAQRFVRSREPCFEVRKGGNIGESWKVIWRSDRHLKTSNHLKKQLLHIKMY